MAIADLLERKFAVNPFVNKVEVERKPELMVDAGIADSRELERTVKEFARLKNITDKINKEQVDDLVAEIFNPHQIQMILLGISQTIDPQSEKYPFSGLTASGLYLSKLIQASYDAGNNDFMLDFLDVKTNLIGLKGSKINPIKITIMDYAQGHFGINSEHCIFEMQGGVALMCGYGTKDCTYIIHGNADIDCGVASKNCNFKLMKDVKSYFGSRSENSNYHVIGNAGARLGERSKNCTYTVCGTIDGCLSEEVKNSTFKVMDKDIYGQLINRLPRTNIIQFVDGNENVILETRK